MDSGDRLTESRADSHGRRDRAQRKIKPPGATRQIGDHQDGNDAENACTDAVEHLNADQQVEAVGEGVKNAADRQYPESYEQQGLSTPRAGRCGPPMPREV